MVGPLVEVTGPVLTWRALGPLLPAVGRIGERMSAGRYLALALALAVPVERANAGCAGDPAPCRADGGTYTIELPANVPSPLASVMFLHGYGGSGEGSMRNREMVDTLLARGYAVIAPDGTLMDDRKGRSWGFRPRPSGRNDIEFLETVRDDAADRFGLDKDRMLLAGFSVGGSMVSYLACADPGAFVAYAPISGGFWWPEPTACNGPVRLLHTHGWTDTTVPLEGRILRGTNLRDPDVLAQGDIFHTLEIWRETNGCDQLRADRFETRGPFWIRLWTRCTTGSALEFVLFPGDHRVPQGWAALALDWFEGG